jgi:hypothetical protein
LSTSSAGRGWSHLPGARAGETGDADNAFDFRHELAAAQVGLDDVADGGGRSATRSTSHFVAFEIDQRQAFVGGGDGEGAHRGDAFVANALGVGQHQAAEIVAVQLKLTLDMAGFVTYSAWALGSSGERGSTGSVSTLRAWAMYSLW